MGNKHKLPGVFSPEQLVKLMEVIDRPKVGVAVALAFFCGLRINEVCSLRIDNVDLSGKKLKIVDSKYTLRKKTGYGKDRYVTIPDQMINPLRKWISIIEGGNWLFPSDKSPDAALRKKSLYEQFHFYLKKADLCIPESQITYKQRINGKRIERTITRHKFYFHTLRHSYAVYLVNKGVRLDTIKNALGHERYDTTLVYARIGTVEMDREINGAFGNSLRSQVIPSERVKQAIALPSPQQSPVEFLQMQLLRGEISEVDYQRKLALLQQVNIKLIQ